MSLRDDLRAFARYSVGLRAFLRNPMDVKEGAAVLEQRLRDRERTFLSLLEHSVYSRPNSLYRRLLREAGTELGDVVGMVERDGIEATLELLYDAGVYVTQDEFKGRRPVERHGLDLQVSPEEFDNPLVEPALGIESGGSRGAPRPVMFDFEHLAYDVAYDAIFLAGHGLADRPGALWRTLPPGGVGLKNVLRYLRLRRPFERWFTPTRLQLRRDTWKDLVLLRYTALGAKRWGGSFPEIEHVPLGAPDVVARWLAEKATAETPAVLGAAPGGAARVVLAATERSLDLAGTFFRVSSEPLTEAKAKLITAVGAYVAADYAMVELGRVGAACGARRQVDEVHVLTDKVAVIQRERGIAHSRLRPKSLIFTSLSTSTPKLMLNVDTGDYAELERRECGCVLGAIGFTTHLSGIRSHEKLTSEGVTFAGSDLITLLEETLPARFGGHATDYQLVEREVGGVPQVAIVVSPRVGDVDEAAITRAVLTSLGAGPAYRGMMADVWRAGETLRVVRREPYETPAAKVLPLHVLESE